MNYKPFYGPHSQTSKDAISIGSVNSWKDPVVRQRRMDGIQRALMNKLEGDRICACGCNQTFKVKHHSTKYIHGHSKATINGIPKAEWYKQYEHKRKYEIRYYIQNRIADWRRKGTAFDLTVDYLVGMYNGPE